MTTGYLRPYRGSWRPIAFLSIGLGCFVLQLAILVTLVHIGIPRTEANALGFLASAQVKFVLSCQFVWSDRPARRGGFWQRFAAFNATTFVAFIANTIVFAASNGTVGIVVGSVLGVASGTIISYVACDLLVFRASHVAGGDGVTAEGVPVEGHP